MIGPLNLPPIARRAWIRGSIEDLVEAAAVLKRGCKDGKLPHDNEAGHALDIANAIHKVLKETDSGLFNEQRKAEKEEPAVDDDEPSPDEAVPTEMRVLAAPAEDEDEDEDDELEGDEADAEDPAEAALA